MIFGEDLLEILRCCWSCCWICTKDDILASVLCDFELFSGPDICVIEPTSITQQNSVRDLLEENETLLSTRLPKP